MYSIFFFFKRNNQRGYTSAFFSFRGQKGMTTDDDVPMLGFCRICLEENEPFVSPCACTSKVHLKCLNKWRYQFPLNHEKRERCEVCLNKYNLPDMERYRQYGIFLFWVILSVGGVVSIPFISILPAFFQLMVGIAVLCCFVVTHAEFNRLRNRRNHPPFLINITILLCGGLTVFYIMELPNNEDTVLVYIYLVFGTYMIMHVMAWGCKQLSQ